ncbi:MAG: hypothetical protein HY036_04805 [Nitrospirae bacterium]|nr:hypothetical protein [Nitrospirota bacterium]MBI3351879.1 hypothetical protein [Nitrospirota bacterium]
MGNKTIPGTAGKETLPTTAGKEIVSMCTKCKLPLEHTIIAAADGKVLKVQCKICGGQHRFVSPDAKVTVRRPRVKKEQVWEQLIKPVSSKTKIPYTLSGRYRGNDLIDHPVFGIGIVKEILSKEKFLVVFKEGEKLLASGRLPV